MRIFFLKFPHKLLKYSWHGGLSVSFGRPLKFIGPRSLCFTGTQTILFILIIRMYFNTKHYATVMT